MANNRGFPYSLAWAEEVFTQFQISYARAGNLLRVFAQMIRESGVECTAEQVRGILIEELRQRKGQKTWELFKKCAKYPGNWDDKRMRLYSLQLAQKIHELKMEKAELYFDFAEKTGLQG